MGCDFWRCDTERCCMNSMICDDILCLRWLKRECDTCFMRANCQYRAVYEMQKVKENEKDTFE